MGLIFYAGIGSRNVPKHVTKMMERIAFNAAKEGLILRSGGAKGSDSAFEQGCLRVSGKMEIFLPWNGFQGKYKDDERYFISLSEESKQSVEQFHPNPKKLSDSARLLMARNYHQIYGNDGTLSKFVICYTENGTGEGGTGQALRIAKSLNIPVYDLGNVETLKKFL